MTRQNWVERHVVPDVEDFPAKAAIDCSWAGEYGCAVEPKPEVVLDCQALQFAGWNNQALDHWILGHWMLAHWIGVLIDSELAQQSDRWTLDTLGYAV